MRHFPLYTLLLAAVLSCLPLAAQNNPYGIDDECYRHMTAADALIGKPGFEEENEALLRTALEKGDLKAQNLYYVELLRDCIHRPDADCVACARFSRASSIYIPLLDSFVYRVARGALDSIAARIVE